MSTLTPEMSANQRDAIARLCAEGLDQDALVEVSRRVNAMVPFDAAFWSATDPLTRLATSPALVENFPDDACAPYWEHEFLADDYLRFSDLASAARPVGTLHDATCGRPGRSGRHRDVLMPAGLDAEARIAFARGGTLWGFAGLYREVGQAGFTEGEVALLGDLVPLVAEGMRRRAFAAPGPVAGGLPASPGMILFDEAGRLLSMNAAADTWLGLLPPEPLHRIVRPEPNMQTEMVSVIQRARGLALAAPAVAAAVGGMPPGEARLRVRATNGLWLVIHASCLAEPGGRPDGHIAVAIEAAKGSEMAPIIAQALGLTGREQEITHAVARGGDGGDRGPSAPVAAHGARPPEGGVREGRRVEPRRAGGAAVLGPLSAGPARRGDGAQPLRPPAGRLGGRSFSVGPMGHRDTTPPELVVYTAEGCCLCDDARAVLDRLAPELGVEVKWVHIDGDADLETRWRLEIPVGLLNGRKVFKYRVDEGFLRRRVARLG